MPEPGPAPDTAVAPKRSAGRRDLILVAAVAVVVFVVGMGFDLFGRLYAWVEARPPGAAAGIYGLLLISMLSAVTIAGLRWRQARREASLRVETERRFQVLVEEVPAVTYAWDPTAAAGTSIPLYVSPQIERMLGYTPEEWRADPMLWIERLHPEDRDRVVAASDKADRDGSPFHEEYRAIARDGHVVWIRDESVVVASDPHGRPVRAHGVMFDITRQKDAEGRLQEAENRYRSLVEHLPVVPYVTASRVGRAGDVLRYIAPTIEELSGYPAEEWLRVPDFWLSTIHPADRDGAVSLSRETDVSGTRFDVEYRMVRKDGSVIWVHDRAIVVTTEGQDVIWQGVLQDITDRRHAEERRGEAELRFRSLVEQLPAITYIEEPGSGHILYISPQIEQVYGYTPEEWQAVPDRWATLLHPEDRERVLAADAKDTGDQWSQVYRSITRDGRTIWLHNEASLLRDARGEPLCWQGVVFDITEHKEAEERLREAQERYRALVEQVPVVVYMDAVDDTSTALYISPQYERLTGYPPERRVAEPELWVNMLYPLDRERILEESLRTNRTGDPFDVEYRIVRADGEVIWVHDHAVLTAGPDGVPVWQGVLTDITAQRLAQEALGRRDGILEAAGHAAERFLKTAAWTDAIDDVLERVGRAAGAARAFVYRFDEGAADPIPVHEWRALPDPSIAQTTEGAALEVPVTVDGESWGSIGFEGDPVAWQTAEVDAIRVVANTLGAAIGRQRAAQRLSEAEARFRALVEQTPVITYLDEHRDGDDDEHRDGDRWSTVYISPQVEQILGYAPEVFLADPTRWSEMIHPGDRERAHLADQAHYTTGEPLDVEIRLFSKDGTMRWVRDQAVVLRDAEGRPRWSQGVILDVTEQKLAEQQLYDAEARYRGLIETIPAATYIDTVDAISQAIYMSPQVERIYGYTPEEWRDQPSLWEDGLHPDDHDEIVRRVERHNREGVPYEAEYRFRHRDGRWVWVHDEAVMILDEDGAPRFSQGVVFDITPLKRHEEQLRETEERFRAIVEHVPSAIYLDKADASMESLYISPQIERIAGITTDEWLADPELWLRLTHPDDRDRVRESYLAAATAARPWTAEYRMRTRDGRTIWVQDETTILHDEAGNPTYMQGVISDITERRLAEQALRDSEQREREAAERLRALDEMKNTFLAAVSHELRSPLTSILGLSLTLERSPELEDDDRSDLLGRLSSNARKLDRLLKDLLDIDRLNRGIVEPQYRTVDVGSLARRTAESLESLADRRVIVGADPLLLSADPAKIERIVENLLMNAARHTAADRRIWLLVEPHEGGALICVEDDGDGVAPELREAIFEPFRQGPTAPPHAPGTGIGLSLVGRFAELHGGRAWVQERDGGGASFRVFIPDRSDAAAPDDAPRPTVLHRAG